MAKNSTKKKVSKKGKRTPTNNGLTQGKSTSAYPMFGPNNKSRLMQNRRPFTGTTGAAQSSY